MPLNIAELYLQLLPPPGSAVPPGIAIASAAIERIRADGMGYAFASAPTSPLIGLSGNKLPGVSRPAWLMNRNKCNQFVGDALTQAGFAMPTVRMPDGSLHYALAETLPRQTNHFSRLGSASAASPGDLVVWDYAKRGAGGGHVEIVVDAWPATGKLLLAGAHSQGAYLRAVDRPVAGMSFDATLGGWRGSGRDIYLLRPLGRHL